MDEPTWKIWQLMRLERGHIIMAKIVRSMDDDDAGEWHRVKFNSIKLNKANDWIVSVTSFPTYDDVLDDILGGFTFSALADDVKLIPSDDLMSVERVRRDHDESQKERGDNEEG